MPQGKMKNKVKLPGLVAAKKKGKGKAVTQRGNAPIRKKPDKNLAAKKLKSAVTKTLNAAAEEELRAVAFDSKQGATKKSKK